MFCTKCGNQLADDDRFCIKCGAAVKGAPQPQNNPAPEVPKAEAPKQEEAKRAPGPVPEPEAPKAPADGGAAQPPPSPAPEAPKAETTENSTKPEVTKEEALAKKRAAIQRKINKIGAIAACIIFIAILINAGIQGYYGITHHDRLIEEARKEFIDTLDIEGVNMDRYEIVDLELIEQEGKEDFYTAKYSIRVPSGEVESGTFEVEDLNPWSWTRLISSRRANKLRSNETVVAVSCQVEELPVSLRWELLQSRSNTTEEQETIRRVRRAAQDIQKRLLLQKH